MEVGERGEIGGEEASASGEATGEVLAGMKSGSLCLRRPLSGVLLELRE